MITSYSKLILMDKHKSGPTLSVHISEDAINALSSGFGCFVCTLCPLNDKNPIKENNGNSDFSTSNLISNSRQGNLLEGTNNTDNINTIHGNKLFATFEKEEFVSHLTEYHRNNNFLPCIFCHHAIALSNIVQHVEMHLAVKNYPLLPFNCDFEHCSSAKLSMDYSLSQFKSISELQEHRMKYHAWEVDDFTCGKICKECNTYFFDETIYLNHLEKYSITLYHCLFPNCLVKSTNSFFIIDHLRDHENSLDPVTLTATQERICGHIYNLNGNKNSIDNNKPNTIALPGDSVSPNYSYYVCSFCSYSTLCCEKFHHHLSVTCLALQGRFNPSNIGGMLYSSNGGSGGGSGSGGSGAQSYSIYKCIICNNFTSTELSLLVDHTNLHHNSIQLDDRIVCLDKVFVPKLSNFYSSSNNTLSSSSNTIHNKSGNRNNNYSSSLDVNLALDEKNNIHIKVSPANNLLHAATTSLHHDDLWSTLDINKYPFLKSSEFQMSSETIALPFYQEAFERDFTGENEEKNRLILKMKRFSQYHVRIIGRLKHRRVPVCPECSKVFEHGLGDFKRHLLSHHLQVSGETMQQCLRYTRTSKNDDNVVDTGGGIGGMTGHHHHLLHSSSAHHHHPPPPPPPPHSLHSHPLHHQQHSHLLPDISVTNDKITKTSSNNLKESIGLTVGNKKSSGSEIIAGAGESIRVISLPHSPKALYDLLHNEVNSSDLLDQIMNKMHQYSSYKAVIVMKDNQRVYNCKECQYTSVHCLADVRKHVMGIHCGIPNRFVRFCLQASRLDRNDFRLFNYEKLMSWVDSKVTNGHLSSLRNSGSPLPNASPSNTTGTHAGGVGTGGGATNANNNLIINCRNGANTTATTTTFSSGNKKGNKKRMSHNKIGGIGGGGGHIVSPKSTPAPILSNSSFPLDDRDQTMGEITEEDMGSVSSMNTSSIQPLSKRPRRDPDLEILGGGGIGGGVSPDNSIKNSDDISNDKIPLPFSENALRVLAHRFLKNNPSLLSQDSDSGTSSPQTLTATAIINMLVQRMQIYSSFFVIHNHIRHVTQDFTCQCGHVFQVAKLPGSKNRPATLSDCRRHVLGVHAKIPSEYLTLCCQASRLNRHRDFQIYSDDELIEFASSAPGVRPSSSLSASKSHLNNNNTNNNNNNQHHHQHHQQQQHHSHSTTSTTDSHTNSTSNVTNLPPGSNAGDNNPLIFHSYSLLSPKSSTNSNKMTTSSDGLTTTPATTTTPTGAAGGVTSTSAITKTRKSDRRSSSTFGSMAPPDGGVYNGRSIVLHHGQSRVERIIDLPFSITALRTILKDYLPDELFPFLEQKMKIYGSYKVLVKKIEGKRHLCCSGCPSSSIYGIGDIRKHILGVHAKVPERYKSACLCCSRLSRDDYSLLSDDHLLNDNTMKWKGAPIKVWQELSDAEKKALMIMANYIPPDDDESAYLFRDDYGISSNPNLLFSSTQIQEEPLKIKISRQDTASGGGGGGTGNTGGGGGGAIGAGSGSGSDFKSAPASPDRFSSISMVNRNGQLLGSASFTTAAASHQHHHHHQNNNSSSIKSSTEQYVIVYHSKNNCFTCNACDFSDNNVEEVRCHIVDSHCAVPPFACDMCAKPLHSRHAAMRHYALVHRKTIEDKDLIPGADFECLSRSLEVVDSCSLNELESSASPLLNESHVTSSSLLPPPPPAASSSSSHHHNHYNNNNNNATLLSSSSLSVDNHNHQTVKNRRKRPPVKATITASPSTTEALFVNGNSLLHSPTDGRESLKSPSYQPPFDGVVVVVPKSPPQQT